MGLKPQNSNANKNGQVKIVERLCSTLRSVMNMDTLNWLISNQKYKKNCQKIKRNALSNQKSSVFWLSTANTLKSLLLRNLQQKKIQTSERFQLMMINHKKNLILLKSQKIVVKSSQIQKKISRSYLLSKKGSWLTRIKAWISEERKIQAKPCCQTTLAVCL
jgi:predicted DNA-binding protein (MmcQ/YjbR family)